MRTAWLLRGGVTGAVVFPVAFTLIGAVRAEYDPVRHFVSILSLGDGGWQQIVNFVIGGVLITVLGWGLGPGWRSGVGSRWVPRLVIITGVALVGCGVFVPDPSLGYPPGTANELVTPLTWHGALHYVCATTIGLAMSGAVLLSLRRGFASGDRALAGASIATAVAAVGGCGLVLVFGGPDPVQRTGLVERIGIYAGWAWLTVVGFLTLRRVA
jgi:hypothetical protein